MSKPTLYYIENNLSPPGRTVQLTGAAIGLEFNLIPINLFEKEHLTAEFRKLNPQHTVPTLIDTDGSVVTDSHAICAYLVQKYGKLEHQSLYPKDLVQRAKVDARLHFDSGFLFARLRFLYEPVLYYGSADNYDEKVEYILKAFETLNSILEDNSYVAGHYLTIADFACMSSITSVDEVAPIDGQKLPHLVAWMKRIEALPYFKEINDIGSEKLKAAFKKKYAENVANKK